MKLSKQAAETAPRIAKVIKDVDGSLDVELFATVNGEEARVLGYCLNREDLKLAVRLGNAWKARAFFKVLRISPYSPLANLPADQGHVSSTDYAPLGRRLNADLKLLGY